MFISTLLTPQYIAGARSPGLSCKPEVAEVNPAVIPSNNGQAEL